MKGLKKEEDLVKVKEAKKDIKKPLDKPQVDKDGITQN